MNLYSQILFPRLLDWAMSTEVITKQRRELLAEVSGTVLEIGLGTGLNLPHYPDTVQKLTAIDPNGGMTRLAQKRLQETSLNVEIHQLSGEHLPFEDQQFDNVVSTWTLCSIPKVDQALKEIYRVLKPQGRFFFVEHGLSPDPGVQTWQNRLNPIQKIMADGCHLNRNIEQLITTENFRLQTLEKCYLADTPKFLGYLYRGVAQKHLTAS